MIWPATLALALTGWLLASIPGLLLGALLGVWLDRRFNLNNWSSLKQRLGRVAGKSNPVHSGFMLLGYLAKLNGRVVPAHIEQARLEMQRMELEGYRYQAAIAAFNRGKTTELNALRADLQVAFTKTSEAEVLLLAAWRLVWAEGRVSRVQYQTIAQCARWLGISAERMLQLEQQVKPAPHRGGGAASFKVKVDERDRALRLLGLQPPVADFARVRHAYRKLLSENHPDRLIGAGASQERIQRANEQTQALHAAYRLLRRYYRQR